MKQFLSIVLLGAIAAGCSANNPYTIEMDGSGRELITGNFDRSLLMKDSVTRVWFDGNYRSYDINPTDQAGLDTLLRGKSFVVVMGTWCSDSRREVPHFFKVLDSAHVVADSVRIIGVDREKRSPRHDAEPLKIRLVPTFIVLEKGRELGRIEESPQESMEYDLKRIATPR